MLKVIIKASFLTFQKINDGDFSNVETELDLLGIDYDQETLKTASYICSTSKSLSEALKKVDDGSDYLKLAKEEFKKQEITKKKAEKKATIKEAERELEKELAKVSNPLYSISEYKIIEAKNASELEGKVRKEIKKGYVPYGGLSTYNPGGQLLTVPASFFQAMVRLKK
tara:strand:- start:141 stop:647 length:507 start_codon:yes stop_codon:yes gene_type:complete